MPPDLRKRKAAGQPAAAPPAKQKGPIAKAAAKVKEAVAPKSKVAKQNGTTSASATKAPAKIAVGETIDLEGFGGEIETNDGVKTTLKKLVEESATGVVLFTYPKASTPGCTKQVCFFRDSYTPLTSTGFAIYGLSKDSPKANTTFKTKYELPYPLLCDTNASLITAIGLKKAPSGTTRGVFVIDKSGKILATEPGGPEATMNVVKKLIDSTEAVEAPAPVAETKSLVEETKTEEAVPVPETKTEVNGTNATKEEDVAQAEVAGEVADTAEKLDEAKVAV